jgi:hypothetical protein
MLAGLIILAAAGHPEVLAQAKHDVNTIEMTRAQVMKIGTGSKAKVEVKLKDDTKWKGYISDAGQDSFTLTDSKTGAAQTVNYSEVAQVKKSGGGLSTRSWIIIGGAGAAAAIVGLTVVRPVLCDGGAGC